MKKLYITARNHMDPSWLRCFEEHFDNSSFGGTVRPYTDIEELQILEYMDFAEKYGVKYHIEQSLVVKKFLERNPDQRERFEKLVKDGYLELAGGGETVIDMNMTQGESWARNHLYSRIYYKKEFDRTPKYAITPDIFGLPSQIPQFFRSIGYDALIVFDRVMFGNKPYWRGLDGTEIVLDSKWLGNTEPTLRTADCTKIPACPVCHGDGCSACEGTGIDMSYNMTRPDKDLSKFGEAYFGNMSAEEVLQNLLEKDPGAESYFLMIVTEEPRIGEYFYGPLGEVASKYGFEVEYLTFEENHDRWCKGQVEKLRSGDYTEDEIETLPEANPVFPGCYSSRIEIKKANRELEDLLMEAERLAVLARLNGGWSGKSVPTRTYPEKKIKALWSKMAFIQFHDCVPGSLCDGSYYEVLRYIREVRRGAEQIYNDAALECLGSIGCEVPDGYRAFIHFNTGMEPVSNIKIKLQVPENTKTIELYDKDMNKISVYDFDVTPELVGGLLKATADTRIPAMGWKIFLWKPSEEAENIKKTSDLKIENEYFSIKAENGRISEIFDKKNGRIVATDSGLNISNEIGTPWVHSEEETGHIGLVADSVSCETSPDFGKLVFRGEFTDKSRNIEKLLWTLTVTLNGKENAVRFLSDLDWVGTNTRIFASVTPAFEHTGKLFGDVPFGLMERGNPSAPISAGRIAQSGVQDEWPTLGVAGVSDGSYNIAFLKGGFPASRIHGKDLQFVLLRAFDDVNPKYNETNEIGRHTSEYALVSWNGTFSDGNTPTKAAVFNRHGHTHAVTNVCQSQGEGTLLKAFDIVPSNICLSALKWAEDGTSPVVRFWESSGSSAVIKMSGNARLVKCNTLEDVCDDEPLSEYCFKPFEISTFKLIL